MLDGTIVGLYLLLTMAAGVMVRKYVSKVEDFIVAGREMNVYLGIASLAATEFGSVTCMYTAQNGYDKGFAGAIPGILTALAMLVVGVTGFCIKPLRDSDAMTIPELLEKRFGQRIRWLAGVVTVLGGLLNMGVFLRTGGDFLVLVCNMSPNVNIFGFEVEMLVVIMTVLLLGVAIYTILGGMLSVLVTDFLQFVVMSAGLIFVTVLILAKIGWAPLVTAVETHYGAGGFNPFLNPDMGWQYVIFNAMPKFLAPFVPMGLMGILVAAMPAADMSTDSSYMLTWASVIYNDIMAPFRKTKWSDRKGLLTNRCIVACIGVFLLFYGLWYTPPGDLWTYLGVTGSIYLASMSTLLIACCYWKRANNWGAGAAILVGAVAPALTLVLQKAGPWTEWFTRNGTLRGIMAYVLAWSGMVAGSLLKPAAGGAR